MEGSLHEPQVGILLATLAGDDGLGHLFWIAKILELMKDEHGHQVKSIVVHWYQMSSLDAFAAKYSLEMVKDIRGTSRKRRRIYRARCHVILHAQQELRRDREGP